MKIRAKFLSRCAIGLLPLFLLLGCDPAALEQACNDGDQSACKIFAALSSTEELLTEQLADATEDEKPIIEAYHACEGGDAAACSEMKGYEEDASTAELVKGVRDNFNTRAAEQLNNVDPNVLASQCASGDQKSCTQKAEYDKLAAAIADSEAKMAEMDALLTEAASLQTQCDAGDTDSCIKLNDIQQEVNALQALLGQNADLIDDMSAELREQGLTQVTRFNEDTGEVEDVFVDASGNTQEFERSYTGNVTVTGTVAISFISSVDEQALADNTASGKPRGKVTVSANKKLLVYAIEGDGSRVLITKDITVTINTADATTGDLGFTVKGLKDNTNYVFAFVDVNTTTSKTLVMQAVVTAKAEPTAEDAVLVSPESTVVAEVVVSQVKDAFLSAKTSFSQKLVSQVVTKARLETQAEVAEQGLPSVVIHKTVSVTNLKLTEVKSTEVSKLVGQVASRTEFKKAISSVKIEAKRLAVELDSMRGSKDVDTNRAIKRRLIERVFAELNGDDEGDNGDPKFLLDFFADKTVEGYTSSTQHVLDDILDGLEWRDDVLSSPAMNTLSSDDAITKFGETISYMLTLLQEKEDALKDGTEVSAESQEKLADMPPVLQALFPLREKEKWASVTGETLLTAPQIIVLVSFVVEKYIPSKLGNELMKDDFTASQGDGNTGINTERKEAVEFANPGPLLTRMGFDPSQYSGVEIMHFEARPDRVWIENADGHGGQERDALNVTACIGDEVSIMMGHMGMDNPNAAMNVSPGPEGGTGDPNGGGAGDPNCGGAGDPNCTPNNGGGNNLNVTDVMLSYPAKDSAGSIVQKTIALNPAQDGGGGQESCFVLSPWNHQNGQPNRSDRIVSDFATGVYKVTALSDGETLERGFHRIMITGLRNVAPTLTNPVGEPRWPGEQASQADRNRFDIAMQSYSPTTFAADDDGYARITVEWEDPKITLPEGLDVVMAYDLDIGRNSQSQCDENGCGQWQHIYATWEGRGDHRIVGNSLEIPVPLASIEPNDPPYDLNMNVTFIDAKTGDHIGQGGHAHARFRVGTPLDPTTEFTVKGDVRLPDDMSASDSYRVVLMREYDVPPTSDFVRQWTHVRETVAVSAVLAAGATEYTLTATLGDMLERKQGWTNFVLFNDVDRNGKIDDNDHPQYWPHDHASMNVRDGQVWMEECGMNDEGHHECHSDVVDGESILDGPFLCGADYEACSGAGGVEIDDDLFGGAGGENNGEPQSLSAGFFKVVLEDEAVTIEGVFDNPFAADLSSSFVPSIALSPAPQADGTTPSVQQLYHQLYDDTLGVTDDNGNETSRKGRFMMVSDGHSFVLVKRVRGMDWCDPKLDEIDHPVQVVVSTEKVSVMKSHMTEVNDAFKDAVGQQVSDFSDSCVPEGMANIDDGTMGPDDGNIGAGGAGDGQTAQ